MVFLLFVTGCGPSTPPVAGGKSVEHWIEALQDKDPSVREKAVKKLGNMGDKDQSAMSAVFDALSDPAPSVRKEAIYAVVRNRQASRQALPFLDEMKEHDEDAEIRKIADEAYGNLSNRN